MTSPPAEWRRVPLADVVEETQYGTAQKANDQGLGIPVLRMNNITYSGKLDLTDLKHVELPSKDLEQYSVRRGDLLFNRTNSQELVGKTGVWDRDEAFAFAGYLVRVRLKTKVADPHFVAAWFNTGEMKSLLRTRAKPSINMSNISASELMKFPVVIPPVSEQRRIANVLDRAEALRAKRRAALAQLDELAQSIFLDLFGDAEANPRKWKRERLESLLTDGPQNGLYKPARMYGEGVAILRIDAFYDGSITKLNSLKRLRLADTERALYALRADDIVINRVNSMEYLGKSALVPELHEPVVFESNMMRVSIDRERVHPKYLIHFLQTAFIRKQIGSAAKHAVNQSSINQQDVKAFVINVPPFVVQMDFAQRIAAVEKLKAAQRASLAELDALFASLQHRAFRGEL